MEKIIRRYKGTGFTLTPQRMAILEYLDGNTDHPTADDILQGTRTKFPTISFATVYNTLEALKERGELVEVTIDPERKHFDPNPAPHNHIICSACGHIADVFVNYSEALNLPEDVRKGFHVTGNHVEFYGICNECSN